MRGITMKKLKYNRKARILAAILAIIFGTLTASGTAITYFTYQMGLYTCSLDDVIRQKQQIAQEIYSMQIFEHLDDIAKKQWTLKNTNMEYGIICAKNLKNIDVNDKSLYWDFHFDDTMPAGNSYRAMEIHVNDTLSYESRLLPSLTGHNIWHFDDGDTDTLGLAPVSQICYNAADNIFYFTTNNHSYPVTTVGISVEDAVRRDAKELWEADTETYPGESYINLDENHDRAYFQLNPKSKKYVSISGQYEDLDTSQYKTWEKITLDTYTTEAIAIPSKGKLLPENEKVTDATLIATEEINMYRAALYEEDTLNEEQGNATPHTLTMARYTISQESDNTYWIISQVKPVDKWTTQNDLIAKQHSVLTALHHYRYLTIAATMIAAILTMLFAAFCIYSAGYCRNEDDGYIFCSKKQDVLLTWRQKIPLELYVIAVGIVLLALLGLVVSSAEDLLSGSLPSWLAVMYGGIALVLALSCGLVLCMNIAHRIHGRILGKYTLWKTIWKKLKQIGAAIQKNTPLILKGTVIYAAFSLIELLIMAVLWEQEFFLLLFWCWLKLVVFVLLIVVISQLKALQQSSQELANGNLSHRMDTTKMFWEFKKHGDNLNQIHEGMAIALEERMKSEHFKTELITNVSHDIKTPLTSIINYVDLLQKEGVTEKDREEYLEVLDRQSKRLKKLIEDLIEASKASTGNLSVNLEPCNLDILLTQTLGEFQEKMYSANLDLMIAGSGNGIHIQADSRHLWRIFDNLMNNICKYAQPGTRVYVNLEVSDGAVSIIFRNTSREPLNISGEELMERFVRGDSSRNTEGNGLGLSIARNLTELMGGIFQIYVDGDLFKVIVKFSL